MLTKYKICQNGDSFSESSLITATTPDSSVLDNAPVIGPINGLESAAITSPSYKDPSEMPLLKAVGEGNLDATCIKDFTSTSTEPEIALLKENLLRVTNNVVGDI